MTWRTAVGEFWDRFTVDLDKASDKMESYKAGIPTGQKCEKCGQGELLERISRHGFFLGCSRYPDCDFIRDLSPELPPEGEDGAGLRKGLQFPLEIRLAIPLLGRGRPIPRRGAAHGGGQVEVRIVEAIPASERGRLVREPGLVEPPD